MNINNAGIDTDARYLDSHEWARKESPNTFRVGISSHAEASLGDIVFVELPETGALVKKGAVFGVVESVKAASDLYAPLGGTVLEVNKALKDKPDLINEDCYDKGWLLLISADTPSDFDSLLDAEAYGKLV